MNRIQNTSGKANKRLPIWSLVLIDILATCLALSAFAFFHLVLPRLQEQKAIEQMPMVQTATEIDAPVSTPMIQNATETDNPVSTPMIQTATETDTPVTMPMIQTETETETPVSMPETTPETVSAPLDDWKFADLTTEDVVINDSGYSSHDIRIDITAYGEGEGVIKSPYTVADIYVRDVRCLQSYFAGGKYIPTGHGSPILRLMDESGAILAANGDYYSMQQGSAVLRNGILYRYPKSDFDVFVLYEDGSVKIYRRKTIRTKKGWEEAFDHAWQVWSFGPSLLDEDGKQYTNIRENMFGFIVNRNPRTAIGYFEPGHYCLVVVDGRSDEASGATLEELASVFEDLGCAQAYNLDGGGSSVMAFHDQIITNQSIERKLPDIILVAEYEGSFAQLELQSRQEDQP